MYFRCTQINERAITTGTEHRVFQNFPVRAITTPVTFNQICVVLFIPYRLNLHKKPSLFPLYHVYHTFAYFKRFVLELQKRGKQ